MAKPKTRGPYEDARLRMAAYLERIRRGQGVKEPLRPMIEAKTNTVTRYF